MTFGGDAHACFGAIRRGARVAAHLVMTRPSLFLFFVVTGCSAGAIEEGSSAASPEGNSKISSVDLHEGRATEEPADDSTNDERGGEGTISGLWVYDHVQSFANSACSNVGVCAASTYNGHHPNASRALDLMIGSYGSWPSAAFNAKGDALAQFALNNMRKFGIWYVIWKQRINYGDGGGWQWMEDRGSITQNHYDHVHVSFWTTANMSLPVSGGTTSCSSYTLGRNVPSGTCVQSKTDGAWYQCSRASEWLWAPNAWTGNYGPVGACGARYPL
jgi:hypothetical protein